MLHPRAVGTKLSTMLQSFPAVALLGPRQAGKSTLVRMALPSFAHLDLESATDLARLSNDPEFVLAEHPRLVIDEAQRLPDLFPAARVVLDRNPRHRLVLLGSASPHLVAKVSESLTGRIALVELGPMSVLEHPFEHLWPKGGFPRLHWARPKVPSAEWYDAYLRTTVERDIPSLGFRTSPIQLRRLLTMVAHSHGQVTNLSSLGQSLGVSYHTVAHLLDLFEGVFLIRRLQPYAANVKKRLVKSPKLYVRDSGLLHFLLDAPFTRAGLLSHPRAGASFEGFCVEQLVAHARLKSPSNEGFFYRTHAGTEVDLVLKLGAELIPVEFKLGLAGVVSRSMNEAMSDLGAKRGYIVTLAPETVRLNARVTRMNLESLMRELKLVPTGW